MNPENLWAIGILLPAVGALSIILYNMLVGRINRLEEHMKNEDRDTRHQITGLYHLVLEISNEWHKKGNNSLKNRTGD